MALRIWAPLTTGIVNNTIANQGLSPAIFNLVNNNGKIASNANGKIGSCIERTASGYADCYRSSVNFNLTDDITMMCWAYVSATIGDTANGLITNHNHNDCSGVGITVKQVSDSDYRISCNTGSGGSSRTYMTYYGTTNIKNAWHHLALTYNKSKKILKLYCDGNVEYTLNNYENYAANNPFDIFNWSTGFYTNSQFRPVCKLNDVRLYDNELSIKEIREITKGLCVHFPLNKPNPNYFYNSNLYLNNTSNWYSVNGSSISVTTKDGRKCITGTKGTTNNIVGHNALSYTYTANTNITITISADVYVEVAGTITVGNWAATSSNGWQGLSGTEIWRTSNVLKIGWNHICVTHKNYKNSTYSGALVTAYAYTGTTYYLTNAKLEFSEYPTTWCPSTSDSIYNSLGYNSTTIYDTGGYKNNGTTSGTLTPSGDTIRYNSSLTFSSNSYISYQPPANLYYATYAFWIKKPSSMTNTYGAIHAPITNPNNGDAPWIATNTESYDLWCYFGDNSPYYTYGVAGSLSADTWYHIVYTWNNGVGQFYLNGEKHGSPVTYTTKKYISNSAKSTLGDSYTGSSWASTAYTGQISDFRLYSTVLSDADIKELYNSGASISDNGTLFAYEFVEN